MPSCSTAPGTPRLWYCVGCAAASSSSDCTSAAGVEPSTAMLEPLKKSTPVTLAPLSPPMPGEAIHGCVNCVLLSPSAFATSRG
jgi:hypothetical protein